MMEENCTRLARDLLGTSIDYRFKSEIDSESQAKVIRVTKKKITDLVSLAHSTITEVGDLLLTEIVDYYRRQSFYITIRSCIDLKRRRVAILDRILIEAPEREACLLKNLLIYPSERNPNRKIIVEAIRLFAYTYPWRLKNFKSVLSSEEYMEIC